MILPMVICTALCLASCNAGVAEENIESFRKSIEVDYKLTPDQKQALLDRLKEFEGSLGSQDATVDLGTEGDAKHYKTETNLLAAYIDAGLPLTSRFAEWLKRDLESQVSSTFGILSKMTWLTDKRKKDRETVLNQLMFDPENVGPHQSMTSKKMVEHAGWLDDNYESFARWSRRAQEVQASVARWLESPWRREKVSKDKQSELPSEDVLKK